jgi:hypothetical protein
MNPQQLQIHSASNKMLRACSNSASVREGGRRKSTGIFHGPEVDKLGIKVEVTR